MRCVVLFERFFFKVYFFFYEDTITVQKVKSVVLGSWLTATYQEAFTHYTMLYLPVKGDLLELFLILMLSEHGSAHKTDQVYRNVFFS